MIRKLSFKFSLVVFLGFVPSKKLNYKDSLHINPKKHKRQSAEDFLSYNAKIGRNLIENSRILLKPFWTNDMGIYYPYLQN